MNKKKGLRSGFIFSVSILMLSLVMVSYILTVNQVTKDYTRHIPQVSAVEKMAFAFDDIATDLMDYSSRGVSQSGNRTLVWFDTNAYDSGGTSKDSFPEYKEYLENTYSEKIFADLEVKPAWIPNEQCYPSIPGDVCILNDTSSNDETYAMLLDSLNDDDGFTYINITCRGHTFNNFHFSNGDFQNSTPVICELDAFGVVLPSCPYITENDYRSEIILNITVFNPTESYYGFMTANLSNSNPNANIDIHLDNPTVTNTIRIVRGDSSGNCKKSTLGTSYNVPFCLEWILDKDSDCTASVHHYFNSTFSTSGTTLPYYITYSDTAFDSYRNSLAESPW